MKQYKTIDIARRIGIHVNTVRLYEKCALIPRVYLKTQNCTKRQEKDTKGFYHRKHKEVIA